MPVSCLYIHFIFFFVHLFSSRYKNFKLNPSICTAIFTNFRWKIFNCHAETTKFYAQTSKSEITHNSISKRNVLLLRMIFFFFFFHFLNIKFQHVIFMKSVESKIVHSAKKNDYIIHPESFACSSWVIVCSISFWFGANGNSRSICTNISFNQLDLCEMQASEFTLFSLNIVENGKGKR